MTAVLVSLQTDDGIEGIGESVPAPSPSVTMAAVESAAEVLVGKDPLEIMHRWLDMQSQAGFVSFPYTGNAALAGIEMACWDILDILREEAADVIMTDPWQAGGILNFQKAAALCETAGLPLVYHSFAPLSIATRAAMQVLAVSPACIYAHQTYHHMLADDVVRDPVAIQQGQITVDDRPGLGVELDAAKVSEYHERYRDSGYASAYDNTDVREGERFFLPNR